MIPKMGKPKDISLDDIQKEVKKLQSRATTLQSKAIVRTDANVEKTGSAVNLIKYSTQSIERIMIEELGPVIKETYHLVRETRLKLDVYTDATGSYVPTKGIATLVRETQLKMEIHAKATSSILQRNGRGLRKPERNKDLLWSFSICGNYGRCIVWTVGDLGEDPMGPMAKLMRQMIIATHGPWEELFWHFSLKPYHYPIAIFNEGVAATMQASKGRCVKTSMDEAVSWEVRNNVILKGKSPLHYDIFNINHASSS